MILDFRNYNPRRQCVHSACNNGESVQLRAFHQEPAEMFPPMHSTCQGHPKWHGHHGHKKGRPIIFVLGGPGSGKGTQCDRIVRDFGFLHLSSGDLLREEAKRGTEAGREVERMMKSGQLVPAEVTLELLKKAMTAGKKTAKGFLVDGFPRAVDQAELFERKLGRPRLVIFLECPKAEMEKRLLKRGETSGRSDDNRATIMKRFDTFLRESVPVVRFYNQRQPGVVLKVSSVPPPDDVYKEINLAILCFRGEIEDATTCPNCPNFMESCRCPCEECCADCEGKCEEWLCHTYTSEG